VESLVLVVVFKIQKPQNSVTIVEKISHQFAQSAERQIRSIRHFVVNVDFPYNEIP